MWDLEDSKHDIKTVTREKCFINVNLVELLQGLVQLRATELADLNLCVISL